MCSLPAMGYDFDPPHLHSGVMTDLVHPPSQLPPICMPGSDFGDLPYLHNVVLTDLVGCPLVFMLCKCVSSPALLTKRGGGAGHHACCREACKL